MTALAINSTPGLEQKAAKRLGAKVRFDDADMDLFFVAALGWGSAGGLETGQAMYIASNIVDGDADSWARAFGNYGEYLHTEANAFAAKGWQRAAGESRLKAFASFRSAWQFAGIEAQFNALYSKHKMAFATAMRELQMPATFFEVPFAGKLLPGVYLQNENAAAPVVLVIGGADTCFEDLFLTVGRRLLERGYSVALADLPGQGNTATEGLHWMADAEKPISAVTDLLIARFGAVPGKIGLLGLSLGGYFVARAAGHDDRFATVMASTPFPNPAQLFSMAVREAYSLAGANHVPTTAALRSRQVSMWKAGARSAEEMVALTSTMRAEASLVTVPFLSILGGGDSKVFAAQAKEWHQEIRSQRKRFVELDAATGADGHVQVNNRLRLTQEVCGWMSEVLPC